MIHQLIHRLLLRRHFWRHATFSEVAELYTSRMLRMLAINMSMAFMSFYLYQNGYSIQAIIVYWVFYMVVKVILSVPVAKYAAHFGPKHGILMANLLYIPSLVVFAFVPEWGIPAMVATGLLQGASTALYDMGYMIDFSKVKSIDHAGKEIAYMNIVEKIATGLSPLLGGVLAFVAGPRATMWVAAALFALASIPLFKTGEPVPTRQKITFRGFPWRIAWRSLVAETAIGFDTLATTTVWPLLIAVIILGGSGDQVYAELGALLSVVLLAALGASYAYGKLIDRRKGGELLRISVLVHTLVHASRPFVTSPVIVAGVNMANEATATGYNMAFMRGIFDTSDLSGHRTAYLTYIETVFNIGGVIAGVTLLVFLQLLGDANGLRYFFFAAAAVALLIATPKFSLYRR